ncbi:ABC transporter substrate-binding protein [Anaerotalea alkaliphila]|uniref:Carbohydrate ABC transporter substrate-binding protein n=1 Tax=Anaerotalea alkaliphila TaxID=2662126 RepID=A0A7X5KLV1_9FIRM|nr:ABC transporter substrate-binding protein [Anaerotalea alkaliphila]NDL67084.1 carbohydrate ABC transporter substrate-binding protein [Anaerotalea alkaliphila]
MKKMMKVVALMLAFMVLTTACGNKGGTDVGGGEGGEVKLRFSWWGGDERHEATLAAIRLFEDKNPGIKIEAEYGGWQGHQEKVTSQMVGNTAPDVLQVNWNWLYIFSKDGNGFYDLSTLTDHINLDNYDPALMDQTTINGKINGIPVGVTGKVFYFNKTAYDAAGASIPTTFDELYKAAELFKTNLGNDYYPMDLDQYAAFLMSMYYLEQKHGKPFINEENVINYSLGELEEGFDFYLDLVDKGVVPSMETRGAAGNVPMDQTPSWIQGKYGATYEWDSAVAKFQAALEGDQELVTGDYLTGIGNNESALAKISMVYSINKNTKYPVESAKLLEFLVSDPEAVEILGTSRGVPANAAAIEVLEGEGVLAGLNYEGNVKVRGFMGNGISPYFEDSQLQNLYRTVMEELGYGKINAAQAAEKLTSEANRMLAELAK